MDLESLIEEENGGIDASSKRARPQNKLIKKNIERHEILEKRVKK